MLSIDELKFDEKGLIPAVVVDAITKKVLTVAYMNRESLEISMEKGLTCFYSRSRQELWLKGETSGNYQHIVSITADCDGDALVVMVEKDGPACHKGTDSCFTNPVWESEDKQEFSLQGLYDMLVGRNENRPEGSYTTYLFEKGIDKILKKVGEECTEVIIAGKADDKKETVYELADLAYHAMVLMVQMGITVETGENDKMIPSNYHTHTCFCDGKNTPEEMVLEAIRLGCPELGFSGHSYTAFDPEPSMSPEETQAYISAVRQLQKKYAAQIKIRLGIEQDYYSETSTQGYDYVIGSVHFLKKDGMYLPVDHSK